MIKAGGKMKVKAEFICRGKQSTRRVSYERYNGMDESGKSADERFYRCLEWGQGGNVAFVIFP